MTRIKTPVVFTIDRHKAVVLVFVCSLCGLVATRCRTFLVLCPVRRLIVMFSGPCLALRPLPRRPTPITFKEMAAGLFALPIGVIGRLCSVTVALPGHLLYYF